MTAKKRRSGGKRYTQAQVDKLVCAAEHTGYEMGRKEGRYDGVADGVIEGRARAFLDYARVAIKEGTVLFVPPKTAAAVVHFLAPVLCPADTTAGGAQGTWTAQDSAWTTWATATRKE